MSPDRAIGLSRSSRGGFTIIETVVATALLGILSLTVLGGLMFGMRQAHGGLNRAAASSWAQAEIAYLSLESYANLPASSTRTLTQTTGYTTFGAISEPSIPAGFDHAVISVQTLSGISVKQLTLTLYSAPASIYATLSTYVSNYTHP